MAPVRAGAVEAMGRLRDLLDDLAYVQCYAALAGSGLFPADRSLAARLADGLAHEERALVRLLALDEAVARSECTPRIALVADALVAAGLVREHGAVLRAEDLVVVPVLGGYLLTATPPGWRPQALRTGRAYVGEDSLRLARVLPPARGRTVLDLGAGCGIQGILAARGARRAVLTDVEARSLELARLNATLNGDEATVHVVAGDCYEPVAGERFDLVVTLPPYLPSVPGVAHPVLAGGPDGLGLLRRILSGAGDHLAPGGELVALAQLLCDDGGPILRHELDELTGGLEARLACFDWHPVWPYALELTEKLALLHREQPVPLRERFMSSLRSQGITGVCSAFVRLRAPSALGRGGAGSTTVTVLGHHDAGSVLAPAPGLRIGSDSTLRLAVTASGASRVLPAHVAALLAAFDGRRDVAQAVRAAWGAPAAADPRDLLEQGLERAAELADAGLLVTLRPQR